MTHEDMLAAIKSQVDQVPNSFLEFHLMRAYCEACQRSWAWTEVMTVTATGDSDGVVVLAPSDGSVVSHIITVMRPESPALLPATYVPDISVANSDPAYYEFSVPDMLRIWPVRAGATYSLRIPVAKQPNDSYVEFPESLLVHHFEMLYDTALARFYRMPNRPWTNEQLALFHGRRARASQNETRILVQKRYSAAATIPWRYPTFV